MPNEMELAIHKILAYLHNSTISAFYDSKKTCLFFGKKSAYIIDIQGVVLRTSVIWVYGHHERDGHE
jgi:hypothetical protein